MWACRVKDFSYLFLTEQLGWGSSEDAPLTAGRSEVDATSLYLGSQAQAPTKSEGIQTDEMMGIDWNEERLTELRGRPLCASFPTALAECSSVGSAMQLGPTSMSYTHWPVQPQRTSWHLICEVPEWCIFC